MTPGRFNSIRQFLSFGHFRKFCKQQFGEDQKKRVFPFKRDVSIWSKMPAAGEQATCSLVPPRQKMRRADNNSFLSSWKNLEGGRPRLFFFEKTFSHQKGRTWEDTLLAEHLSPAIRPVCMCIRDVYRDARRRKKRGFLIRAAYHPILWPPPSITRHLRPSTISLFLLCCVFK